MSKVFPEWWILTLKAMGDYCSVGSRTRSLFSLYPVWVVALGASASSLCLHSLASFVRQEKCLPCPPAESLGR